MYKRGEGGKFEERFEQKEEKSVGECGEIL